MVSSIMTSSTTSTTTKPILYHIPRTISSPIVQILYELECNHDIIIQEISFSDLKQTEYLKLNPMGTSPTFYDNQNNIIIYESGAILDYILEDYDTKYQLHYPTSSSYHNEYHNDNDTNENNTMKDNKRQQNRAKFLQLKQYIIATVYPFVATMYLHTLKNIEEQDPIYLSNSKEKWNTVIGPILTQWFDGPYYFGNKISAIDYLIMKPLTNINQMNMLHTFPKLQILFDNISQRPSYTIAYNTDGVALQHNRQRLLSQSTVAMSNQQQVQYQESNINDNDDVTISSILTTSIKENDNNNAMSNNIILDDNKSETTTTTPETYNDSQSILTSTTKENDNNNVSNTIIVDHTINKTTTPEIIDTSPPTTTNTTVDNKMIVQQPITSIDSTNDAKTTTIITTLALPLLINRLEISDEEINHVSNHNNNNNNNNNNINAIIDNNNNNKLMNSNHQNRFLNKKKKKITPRKIVLLSWMTKSHNTTTNTNSHQSKPNNNKKNNNNDIQDVVPETTFIMTHHDED